ncbi:MAG: PD40 domain-containing protein [Chitinispirillaceae bacterium]|nr:PD40 domain-containing protein [Chitinispirillaceae bacterium]
MTAKIILVALFLLSFFLTPAVHSASWNAYSMKRYTAETPHFRIYYHDGIEHLVKPVADKLESLYAIYSKTYCCRLPSKTEVLLHDGDESGGLTLVSLNFIILWTHDFDFDLRGSHDWWNDVITHEFAHQMSIWHAMKYPAWLQGIQFGYFTHPNEPRRLDLFHALPSDILPPWFTEGIAQYESSRNGSDSWDSHRDMILRSLAISNRLLTWDHMQVFAGKGDDFEKTYNHGFSLVSYIAEKYGYDKIVAMIRKSAGITRLDFDGVIESVLGIPGRELYRQWRQSLEEHYRERVKNLGNQVCGRKISRDGYANGRPRFSPDGRKVYFLSNGRQDYGFKILCSCDLSDTVKDDERIRPEMNVKSYYDIHAPSGRIAFVSARSGKSELPPAKGGWRTLDLFIDTLPPGKRPFRLFPRKTERQITFRQSIFSAAFSPSGDRLVVARRHYDRFFLAVTDTAGKEYTDIYPDSSSGAPDIHFIYSVAWSPDGRTIAFSYFDKKNRKIGLYDTSTRAMSCLIDTRDNRDPAFSPDGRHLYFSSDRTGIFNLYRYSFETHRLERITNVTGGAFAPALSPDGNKCAYAGYDSSGYGIYLLDSITAVSGTAADTNALFAEQSALPARPAADLMPQTHRPYNKVPRQFLCRPTLLAEQLNTKDNNIYSGASAFKAGVVVNMLDPYSWLGMGTEIGGLFLIEPTKIFKFVNIDHGLIDIGTSFDAALFGSTQIFPLTLSFDYYLRGIAGEYGFFNEQEGLPDTTLYNLRIHKLDMLASHYFAGQGGGMGMGDDQAALHLLAGFDRYDVYMAWEKDKHVFFYNVGKSYRAGAMATVTGQAVDSRRSISPRGLAARLQYDVRRLFSLSENNSLYIDDSSGLPKERYHRFLYHEANMHLKAGTEAPFFGDLHLDLAGNAIRLIRRDTLAFPSFYLPLAWVPGYAYYSRDSAVKSTTAIPVPDTTWTVFDTVLVTGNAVVSGALSYRFPLSGPLIDKKLWIFYLEKLYGCVNLSGGAGVGHPSRLLKFKREDWLLSWGAELRLQAQTFGGYPLAVSFRFDRGWDRPAPLGGNRFTLNIGFDFDNWYLTGLPDYWSPAGAAGR